MQFLFKCSSSDVCVEDQKMKAIAVTDNGYNRVLIISNFSEGNNLESCFIDSTNSANSSNWTKDQHNRTKTNSNENNRAFTARI